MNRWFLVWLVMGTVVVLFLGSTPSFAAGVCPAGQTVKGIDVSEFQGTVNWNSVKASGVVFAFARVSDGTGHMDPTFDSNYAAIKTAGLIRGAYQVFEPGQDPVQQADLLLAKIGTLKPGDLPPVLDVEVSGGLTPAQVVASIHTWISHVQQATGRVPIIYTNPGLWSDFTGGSSDFSTNPLWVAGYGVTCPTLPSAWRNWTFWQYSDSGSVPGISGSVDLDEFNGSMAELNLFAQPTNLAEWSVITSPNNGTSNNFLNGVTCASGSDCWAVGYYVNSSSVDQTLIEHWNGTSWSIVTNSPNNGTRSNVLQAVTCASGSECWAVGYYYDTLNANQTLIGRWNGSSWTIVTSPTTSPGQNNILNGVTCASANECWAVGYYVNGNSVQQTLIEQWDGNTWSIVTNSPNNGSGTNILNGVTCASASQCWAVGFSNNGVPQTLIEKWDGNSWGTAPVTSPNTGATQYNFLNGVTCASGNECWAVGYYNNGSGGFNQTLIEKWDGSSWGTAPVTSPNTGTANNVLNGVTCASATDCWAGGSFSNGSGVQQTLIEQWDGTFWIIYPSPDAGGATQTNYLNGVTCASASECWGVGYYKNGSVNQTLIEEYSLTIPPLTSVGSRMTHGSAGTFDIDLPLTGTRGVECRSSTSLGAGNYAVVFTFVNNMTNCGTAGTAGGSVSSGPNANQCTENLTGVPNAQYATVTLNNVLDSQNNTGNVSVPMGVLIGDVNASGLVDGNDVSAVQGHTRQTPNSTNFRLDVNASGLIDGNDVSLVQSKTRTSLPSAP